jgi:uncharacterized membrane protein
MDSRNTVIPVGDALQFGWQRTLANVKPLLVLGLVGAFLSVLNQGMSGHRGTLLASLAVQLAQTALGLVVLRVLLGIHDGKPADLSRLSEMTKGFVNYLLTSLLVGVMVAFGLVLLVVPGVLLALRFGLAPMLVADKGLEPMEAVRESARLTEGVRPELFAFAAAALGVNLLGALALGFGLLLTIPTTGLAAVYVLRRLQDRAASLPPMQTHSGGAVPPLVAS